MYEIKNRALEMAVQAHTGTAPEHIVKCAVAFEAFLSGRGGEGGSPPESMPPRTGRVLVRLEVDGIQPIETEVPWQSIAAFDASTAGRIIGESAVKLFETAQKDAAS